MFMTASSARVGKSFVTGFGSADNSGSIADAMHIQTTATRASSRVRIADWAGKKFTGLKSDRCFRDLTQTVATNPPFRKKNTRCPAPGVSSFQRAAAASSPAGRIRRGDELYLDFSLRRARHAFVAAGAPVAIHG
jgi:hypothetical protein